jgi:hypothetical protein
MVCCKTQFLTRKRSPFQVLRTITEWDLSDAQKSAIVNKCSGSDNIEALGALSNIGVDVRDKIRNYVLPELADVKVLVDLTKERRQEIIDELAEKDVLKKQKEKDEGAREVRESEERSDGLQYIISSSNIYVNSY